MNRTKVLGTALGVGHHYGGDLLWNASFCTVHVDVIVGGDSDSEKKERESFNETLEIYILPGP